MSGTILEDRDEEKLEPRSVVHCIPSHLQPGTFTEGLRHGMGSHLTCSAQNVHVIACEPSLSNKYKASHRSRCDMESECHLHLTQQEAHNFYKGLVEKTEYVLYTVSLQHSYNCLARGKFVPLGDAEPFQDIITGCALKCTGRHAPSRRY